MPAALKTTAAGISTSLVLLVGVLAALSAVGGVVGFDGWRSGLGGGASRRVDVPALGRSEARANARGTPSTASAARTSAPRPRRASRVSPERTLVARPRNASNPSLPTARRPSARRPVAPAPARTPAAPAVAPPAPPARPVGALGDTVRQVSGGVGRTVAPVSPTLGQTVTDAGNSVSGLLPR